MAVEPHRHLHIVDTDSGQVLDGCPNCAELDRELRRQRTIIANMRADKDRAARESKHWPDAMRLFSFWKEQCDHPRSVLTTERFEMVRRYLENAAYGFNVCLLAIMGARYDAFTAIRKNGTTKRFDSWELIYRDADHLEDFANRAPKDLLHAQAELEAMEA